jgi:hypothetical protein
MNVEIGTDAAQFPETEYRHGIFLAVHPPYFVFLRIFVPSPHFGVGGQRKYLLEN